MQKFKAGDRVRLKASEQAYASKNGLTGDLVIREIGLLDCAEFVGRSGGAFTYRMELVPSLIDPAKKYRTRDGREVRVLCVDGPDPLYPVVAVVNNDGDWNPDDFTAEGRNYPWREGMDDLVEVKAEHTRWIIANPAYGFATQAEAQRAISFKTDQSAIVKVTFTEGEGL